MAFLSDEQRIPVRPHSPHEMIQCHDMKRVGNREICAQMTDEHPLPDSFPE